MTYLRAGAQGGRESVQLWPETHSRVTTRPEDAALYELKPFTVTASLEAVSRYPRGRGLRWKTTGKVSVGYKPLEESVLEDLLPDGSSWLERRTTRRRLGSASL
ncbi:hypothetical protein Bbelb_136550 [Branchiostoma belcheri]|nr:hypothetical protein Bbelb_136550 [Branchiostoma belcheri]